MDSITLEELAQNFADKVSILKSSVSLRNLSKSPCNAIFEANHIVESLKETLHLLREEVKKQNDDLEYLQKDFKNKLQVFNDRLSYIKENVPSSLPRQKTKTKSAKENREIILGKTKLKEIKPSNQKKSDSVMKIDYITNKELNSLPKYMKGRLTCDIINNFIDGFNKTIITKYKLINTPKNQLRNNDIVEVNNFLSQEISETKDLYFCLDQDLKKFGNLTINKMLSSILIILRHCNRIRDIRKNGIVRHVIV